MIIPPKAPEPEAHTAGPDLGRDQLPWETATAPAGPAPAGLPDLSTIGEPAPSATAEPEANVIPPTAEVPTSSENAETTQQFAAHAVPVAAPDFAPPAPSVNNPPAPQASSYIVPGLADAAPSASAQDTDYSPWKDNAPSAQQPRRSSEGRVPESSRAFRSPAGKKPPIAAIAGIVLGVILVGVAAWWLFIYYPTPLPVIKDYVTAPMKNGRDQLAKMGMSQAVANLAANIKVDVGAMKDLKITGDKAVASVEIITTMMGSDVTQTQRFALTKSGSLFQKTWTVDEQATQQLQAEDNQKKLGQLMDSMTPQQKQQMQDMQGKFKQMMPKGAN